MHSLLSGRRVLVVEDEMMVLMNIEGALADLGCAAISSAATVDDALALLKAEHFDVAMLDVNLGGQASYRVADALAGRSIPFVFSTGYGEHGVEPRFGDRPVLQKPYSDADLGAALASLLSAGNAIMA
ncbi:response regulator [Sphingomonas sp. AR_OL41]|uniref:response regulator n=1 Tax=Sphingomonas sp. AR_OL41 TaxID=3042729 RepID=UPI002480E0D7|nr:response regulator [Sphingomonas sp. AR_OL41]MDH7972186.1 response regulator [Sphingomonas sp. AR_OL41]